MVLRRFFFTVFLVLMLSACLAIAQEEEGFVITTQPPGATLYLDGEIDMVANTPARLPADLSGRYKARIARPGFENWKGELTLVPGGNSKIDIKLSKKSRIKATLRSMIIPGWGQTYSGNSFRGSVITGSALASAAAIYLIDRRYQSKRAEYDAALLGYSSAGSIEDRIRLKAELDDRQRTAYNAETDRRTAVVIGVALWTYNVLDALIFFPEGEVFFPSVSSLGDGAALSLTTRF